jgi:uncharacterized protein
MKSIKGIVAFVMLGMLSACGSTPKSTFYSLADVNINQGAMATRKGSPTLAVLPINLPELIDRPQLVVHSGGRQVRLLEQQRWAEPLRREIPRVVADDLGRLLNSSGIVALPPDLQALAPDYRLLLDVQRLDAIEGVGVDVDVLWFLSTRNSILRKGRTTLRLEFQKSTPFPTMLIEAQREALQRVAADIAEAFNAATASSVVR